MSRKNILGGGVGVGLDNKYAYLFLLQQNMDFWQFDLEDYDQPPTQLNGSVVGIRD